MEDFLKQLTKQSNDLKLKKPIFHQKETAFLLRPIQGLVRINLKDILYIEALGKLYEDLPLGKGDSPFYQP